MSRTLKRVPLAFDWPLKQIWTGYVNPYYRLAGTCPDCDHGYDRARGRVDANAALFSDQWYGNAPFDPVTYGAEPLSPDSPEIWAVARYNVGRAPDFYMTLAEKSAERKNLQRAGVDLMELYKTTAELKAELDKPAGDLKSLDVSGLVKIGGHREAAIAREAQRLYDLWRGQWKHQLIQADVDALVEARRLPDFTHRPRTSEQAAKLAAQAADGCSGYWLDEPNGYHPTAAEVNAWSFGGLSHDAINNGVCVEARCAREGVPYMCAVCRIRDDLADARDRAAVRELAEDRAADRRRLPALVDHLRGLSNLAGVRHACTAVHVGRRQRHDVWQLHGDRRRVEEDAGGRLRPRNGRKRERLSMTAPIDIECPCCKSTAGNYCVVQSEFCSIGNGGSPDHKQRVAFHHAERIDAAFRAATRRQHDPRALREALREAIERLAQHSSSLTKPDDWSFRHHHTRGVRPVMKATVFAIKGAIDRSFPGSSS